MMITFFAVTYFLCAFLISMFLNSVSSGVAGRLSDNAEIITVNQDHNSESALTYSDLGDILSKYKAVGAIKLVTEYNCCLPRKTQKVGNHGISRNKAG